MQLPRLPDPIEGLRRETNRMINLARHTAGLSVPGLGPTPRRSIWSSGPATLYRYGVDEQPTTRAILLVYSIITTPDVFDLRSGSSLVEDLIEAGFDVYLLDWGVPGPAESTNTLATYCDDLLPRAIRQVIDESGQESIDALAYCFGGVLALLGLAGHPELPVDRLVLLATPVEFRELGPMVNLLKDGNLDVADLLDPQGNVPATTVHRAFRMSQPTVDAVTHVNLWQALADREDYYAHQAVIGWVGRHIPLPGAILQEVVDLFIRRGALADGVVPVGERVVHLRNLPCRVLNVVGQRDNLVPPASSLPLAAAAAPAPVDELELNAGHTGLFVGRSARKNCSPAIINWLREEA